MFFHLYIFKDAVFEWCHFKKEIGQDFKFIYKCGATKQSFIVVFGYCKFYYIFFVLSKVVKIYTFCINDIAQTDSNDNEIGPPRLDHVLYFVYPTTVFPGL